MAQDALNGYLDERLQDRALQTVEQQIGECDACRLELEELIATVAMMQTLPMEAPKRSFVMSAASRTRTGTSHAGATGAQLGLRRRSFGCRPGWPRR